MDNRHIPAVNADMAWGLILVVGSAVLLTIAYQPQEKSLFSSGDSMVWPKYVLWPLLFLSLLLFLKGFRKGLLASSADASGTRGHRHLARPAILSVLTLGCFGLISIIGFLPFTLLFSGSASFVMGRQRPLAIVIFSALTTLVIWLVFGKGLGLSLPRGISVFRDISFMLY